MFFTDYLAVGFDGSDHAAILPIPTTANVSAQSELPICLTFSSVSFLLTFFVVFFSLQRLRCYLTEFIISTVLS